MKRVLIIFLLFYALPVQAVVVNEIAWMGTEEQWQNEWIELYNEDSHDTSLEKWTLKAEDGSLFIELEGIIKGKSYFLLERSDNSTVPDMEADQIYKGGLNNNGEKLILLKNNETIEEIDCSLGWFAGDNTAKKTMERISPESEASEPSSWKTSSEKGGTPKTINSEKKEVSQKTIASINHKQDFSIILLPGIGFSLLVSVMATGIVLKIKKHERT